MKTGKGKIITATKKLFCSGDSNPSVQKVADEAGVAKSLVYYFFKNKDNLFLEVSKEMSSYMISSLEGIQGENISATNKINKLFKQFKKMNLEGGAFVKFLFKNLQKKDPKFCKIVEENRNKLHKTLMLIVKEGVQKGDFRPLRPEIITNVALCIIDSFILKSSLNNQNDFSSASAFLALIKK